MSGTVYEETAAADFEAHEGEEVKNFFQKYVRHLMWKQECQIQFFLFKELRKHIP